jgi:hypothetical protein
MRDHDELFTALAKSGFRSQFRLRRTELRYLSGKGLATVVEHAREFVKARLAPADPENDGRQTPMRGHPVFVAQHATATCCRSCLAKWHGVEKGTLLSTEEVDYVVDVIAVWLERQTASAIHAEDAEHGSSTATHAQENQRRLF